MKKEHSIQMKKEAQRQKEGDEAEADALLDHLRE
jgi:hypothetical protein